MKSSLFIHQFGHYFRVPPPNPQLGAAMMGGYLPSPIAPGFGVGDVVGNHRESRVAEVAVAVAFAIVTLVPIR